MHVPRKTLKTTIEVFSCVFMLEQQHYTLRKVENVKKHNRSSLKVDLNVSVLLF